MKVSHKSVARKVGHWQERLDSYERAIDALGDEELIEKMVDYRMKRLENPDSVYLRGVSIAVLIEHLRLAKLMLPTEASEWGANGETQES